MLVNIDTGRMTHAMHALLDNALKYTSRGGHITVSAQLVHSDAAPSTSSLHEDCPDGRSGIDFIRIDVADTGIGIAPVYTLPCTYTTVFTHENARED